MLYYNKSRRTIAGRILRLEDDDEDQEDKDERDNGYCAPCESALGGDNAQSAHHTAWPRALPCPAVFVLVPVSPLSGP